VQAGLTPLQAISVTVAPFFQTARIVWVFLSVL
jgi:hypothetical protein